MTSTPSSTLARAKAGDQDAFADLVDPYRRQLLVHCYRILGSVQDAEDVLQEVLLSAWRALDQFDGASLKAWLYRIATNRCLNYLRDGARRPAAAGTPVPGPVSDGEPWWLEPFPDALLDDVTPGPEARYEARESIASVLCGWLATAAGAATRRPGPPGRPGVLLRRNGRDPGLDPGFGK